MKVFIHSKILNIGFGVVLLIAFWVLPVWAKSEKRQTMNSLEALKTTINFYSGNEYSSKSEDEKKSVDADFRAGWLNKYNQEKANGTLPQELAGYDPEQLYDHFVNEAKKSNPGLSEYDKAKANVDGMNSHEYANNVVQYKSTPEYQNLSDEDKAKYNQHFNNRLTQKRIAEGVPVGAPEFNDNSGINADTIKELLNINQSNQLMPTDYCEIFLSFVCFFLNFITNNSAQLP